MRGKRTDLNQKQIVEVFRKMGATVYITSGVGKGFPDIVVGFKGVNYLVEIKDGKAPKSQHKLTGHEDGFHAKWRGSVHIIKSVQEAIDLLNNKL